jgi:hypothetical protein
VWGWVTDTVFQQTGELGPSSSVQPTVQPTGPGSKYSINLFEMGQNYVNE